jgi:hypothetical protein
MANPTRGSLVMRPIAARRASSGAEKTLPARRARLVDDDKVARRLQASHGAFERGAARNEARGRIESDAKAGRHAGRLIFVPRKTG